VLPTALALRLTGRSPGALCAYAAVALFAFWMLDMVLIWLFLLGLSDIASGRYVPFEVVLTLLVGLFCAAGILRGLRAGRLLGRTRRVATVAVLWVVQATVMALSFLPPVVNR